MKGSQAPQAPSLKAPLLTPEHRILGHPGLWAVPGQVLTSESQDAYLSGVRPGARQVHARLGPASSSPPVFEAKEPPSGGTGRAPEPGAATLTLRGPGFLTQSLEQTGLKRIW